MSLQISPPKKIGLKLSLVSLPFILITLTYFIYDPFQSLTKKSFYYNCYIEPNRDYVSTETYLELSKSTRFNSFVFGSSRSMALQCDDWDGLLGPGDTCYHFDAANETLFGIRGKVRLLAERSAPMKHVVIVLDSEILSREDNPMKHPMVSGGSVFEFQLVMFRAYFQEFFFIKYLDYTWFRQYRPYMKGVIWHHPLIFKADNNDKVFGTGDDGAGAASADREAERKKIFYPRDTIDKYSQKPVIADKQYAYLKEISDILKAQQVDVKVAIAPLYNQIYFNKEDLKKLQELFGQAQVFDFSGVNEMTESTDNYIETSHFQPSVGRSMLKEMFGQA